MRTLSFIVDGQILKPDPNCDFSGMIPGSDNYVIAKFTFSPDWNKCVKVAAFWSRMGKEFPPQLLSVNATCIVPSEALDSKYYKIQAIGKRSDGLKIVTNKFEICQNGG